MLVAYTSKGANDSRSQFHHTLYTVRNLLDRFLRQYRLCHSWNARDESRRRRYSWAVNTPSSRKPVLVSTSNLQPVVSHFHVIRYTNFPLHTSRVFAYASVLCQTDGSWSMVVQWYHSNIESLLSYSWTVYSVRPSKLFGFPINSSLKFTASPYHFIKIVMEIERPSRVQLCKRTMYR